MLAEVSSTEISKANEEKKAKKIERDRKIREKKKEKGE